MKTLKKLSTLLLFFFLGHLSVQSQNNEVMQNLTKAQQELMKEQRELVVANREAFIASLTAEQLAILDNKDLSKQERIKYLVSTFTATQKELMAKNKANIEALRETFKSSITAEQRKQMQPQNISKMNETASEASRNRKRN